MVVGAKVCELTDGFLWFVCGNFDVFPYHCWDSFSLFLLSEECSSSNTFCNISFY